MPRRHPLGVEAVPLVEADREREEAEAGVEQGVELAARLLRARRLPRQQLLARNEWHRDLVAPARRGLRSEQVDGDQAVTEPLVQPGQDLALHEHSGGELLGQHDPDPAAGHLGVVDPATASTRAAIEAPSSPCARRASGGVPQAGHPSTPRTCTLALVEAGVTEGPPQRVAQPADRGVILDDDHGL